MSAVDILQVYAHPDDESFGPVASMARYARAGYRVALLVATRGEAGTIANPDAATPATLGEVRVAELQAAAGVIGIASVEVLDYPDGGVPEREVGLAAAVARAIQTLRPRVVVTHGPEGGYGHPDHVAVSRTVTAAFDAVEGEGRAEQPASFRPQRLYYYALPRTLLHDLVGRVPAFRKLVEGPYPPLAQAGTPESEITTVIAAEDLASVKPRAILCHRSQIYPDLSWSNLPPDLVREFYGTDRFVRARPPWTGSDRERELFPERPEPTQ